MTTSFRSLIKTIATTIMKKATTPVNRSDQPRDMFSIMLFVVRAKMTPPIPDPAAVMPLAKLRFFENHWDRTGILGMYTHPTPIPTSAPCERYKCHALSANEAEMKPPARQRTPKNIGGRVPHLRAKYVTSGATSIAAAKLKPPTKAKSSGLAPGKESSLR